MPGWLRLLTTLLAASIGAVALAVCWVLFTTPTPRAQEGWELGPEMPQAFGELATVAVPREEDGSELLVVLSGLAGLGRMVNDVFVFDPERQVWHRGPSLPTPIHHAAAAVLDGAVVVSGGAETLSGEWQGTANVWRWQPGTDVWEAMPPLLEARWGHRMVEHFGRLIVVGGHGETDRTLVYRPDHEGWAEAAPIPAPRDHLSVVVVDDRIWAIGGRSPQNVARVDIYDPGWDSWTSGPGLPAPTSGAAEGVIDGRIYIFGGEEADLLGGGVIDRHWMLDTRREPWQWQPAPPPPLAVHGADGAVLNNRVVIVGGASRHGALSILSWTSVFQVMDAPRD